MQNYHKYLLTSQEVIYNKNNMQTVYLGNTLINDVMLGSQRMDDVFTPLQSFQAEYLIVASGNFGGASGGSPSRRGGGGGAGGLLSGSLVILPYTNYFIQVGGFDGNNISYQSYITGSNIYSVATGGGEGGYGGFTDATKDGKNGGSGGGGGYYSGNNRQYLMSPSVAANTAGTNFGDGGGSATGGSRGTPKVGVVILRYLGPQKFTGGTVTTDGAYTIQTFNNTTDTLGAAYDRFTILYA